ncbi:MULTISPECIES: ABC transporter permease [Methylobacterium]|jgi:peptide/nickel transport system permease protein|uniref:ABC transporter permease n=3 Tax=Methylobacterium TaxID=407 RepID=A0A5C4LKU9_9HYPH|nr:MULTISPECIES: ABC transporter permease [Methylobacterium]MBK3398153.1 ABC transporter permease [Methylobacterium ajmalii]MBK3411078.1 ABC transporter permease [Methylobacterium ajmalii]MBK3423927.1 ABC transporter permease [Methylobacterium ajmalii]MBZ6411844.1 ABC transporter permease [Methylobacterium sp.]TNC15126.1 ABC transporter permease [Methylobacterium terricola]
MGAYLLRRLLIAIPSLLGISLILFTVLALAPGDPFGELATNPNVPPEVREALRLKFGLDDPILVRYLHWLTAMLQGDWGFSFASRVDVDDLILQRLPTTLFVVGSSQVLALLIAVPVGILAAIRPYSVFDQVANTLAFIGFSLPTFFTGLLFILLFSLTLDWLPFVYQADISATGWRWAWEHVRQAIMPVCVLGFFQAASYTRYVRASVLDVARLDYVTTARAKGLSDGTVTVRHIARNALIPVVTLVALQIPAVFGGAIVTEQIFRIPGIGSLLINAMLANDTPVVMAVTFVFACLVVLFNLVADLLYGWLDPRISYR